MSAKAPYESVTHHCLFEQVSFVLDSPHTPEALPGIQKTAATQNPTEAGHASPSAPGLGQPRRSSIRPATAETSTEYFARMEAFTRQPASDPGMPSLCTRNALLTCSQYLPSAILGAWTGDQHHVHGRMYRCLAYKDTLVAVSSSFVWYHCIKALLLAWGTGTRAHFESLCLLLQLLPQRVWAPQPGWKIPWHARPCSKKTF